ncbi:MAG: CARDB domain-containing protein, partial [Candidatus Methylomirabilaceae bacterium]
VEVRPTPEGRITMAHWSKIASLTVIALVSWAGVALAADPKKVPPKLSPSQTPPAPTWQSVPRPDLVPWNAGGPGREAIGVDKFECWGGQQAHHFKIAIGMKNIGTAQTSLAVKSLVRVNGVDVNHPDNPHTYPAGLLPNHQQGYSMVVPAPGLGTHTLWVKVDSDNLQAELNERNNVATATTTCR